MARRPVDADVVVVGGGPAGSAAAIACATRGLSVVLCERERSGRERPGETLHPGIEPLLRQLGIADRLARVVGARHAGIWIEWGGPRRFEAFGGDASGPWNGIQAWRADFDALLLTRARELGVEVRQPCAVTGAMMRDGILHGLETTAGRLRGGGRDAAARGCSAAPSTWPAPLGRCASSRATATWKGRVPTTTRRHSSAMRPVGRGRPWCARGPTNGRGFRSVVSRVPTCRRRNSLA